MLRSQGRRPAPPANASLGGKPRADVKALRAARRPARIRPPGAFRPGSSVRARPAPALSRACRKFSGIRVPMNFSGCGSPRDDDAVAVGDRHRAAGSKTALADVRGQPVQVERRRRRPRSSRRRRREAARRPEAPGCSLTRPDRVFADDEIGRPASPARNSPGRRCWSACSGRTCRQRMPPGSVRRRNARQELRHARRKRGQIGHAPRRDRGLDRLTALTAMSRLRTPSRMRSISEAARCAWSSASRRTSASRSRRSS